MSVILGDVRFSAETIELDDLPDDSYVKWKDGSFGVVVFSILQTELSEACRRRERIFACVASKTESVGIHAGCF